MIVPVELPTLGALQVVDVIQAAAIANRLNSNWDSASYILGPCHEPCYPARSMAYPVTTGGGAGINISSASARLDSPNEYVDYAASKGALETFTIGFAKEVARDGIRVNCIRPGHIYTDMHASGGEPGRVDRVKDSIPMGRGGQPEEVARAILWLASAEASFITGTFLDVTGGK